MKQKFEQPQYLVQIDKKYCTIDKTEIWWYEYSFIKDVKYIEYWSYNYSFKSKKEELFESFERIGEFDKIFSTEMKSIRYMRKFESDFKEYFERKRSVQNMSDAVETNRNKELGKSDARYFSSNSDGWRHS